MKQSSNRVACFDLSALQILLVLYTKKYFQQLAFELRLTVVYFPNWQREGKVSL